MTTRKSEYVIFTDAKQDRHCYGSDAITSSYTGRSGPAPLANAMAGLSDEQKLRYLDPPHTIGSALECIWRHYSTEPENPPAGDLIDAYADFFAVINAYSDFFELFDGFKEFVDFFHFQDLVTPDYKEVRFYLDLDNFERPGTPATKDEYVTYREATLQFIAGRGRRRAGWVTNHHPEVEVICPWRRPNNPETEPAHSGGTESPESL